MSSMKDHKKQDDGDRYTEYLINQYKKHWPPELGEPLRWSLDQWRIWHNSVLPTLKVKGKHHVPNSNDVGKQVSVEVGGDLGDGCTQHPKENSC